MKTTRQSPFLTTATPRRHFLKVSWEVPVTAPVVPWLDARRQAPTLRCKGGTTTSSRDSLDCQGEATSCADKGSCNTCAASAAPRPESVAAAESQHGHPKWTGTHLHACTRFHTHHQQSSALWQSPERVTPCARFFGAAGRQTGGLEREREREMRAEQKLASFGWHGGRHFDARQGRHRRAVSRPRTRRTPTTIFAGRIGEN
eukprot:scaffold7075_cov274-Pinguiococcus_pyrenoidosus.AAC.4